MKVTLTKELEAYVNGKVQAGRYADASEVVRDALRALEQRDDLESPALDSAILDGVRSQHQPYTRNTLDRVRRNARRAR